MSVAAYATILKSVGAPVVINGEPTTQINGTDWQIDDVARRLLDPEAPVQAFDEGNGNAEIGISYVDRFNGIVSLQSLPVGDVVLSTAYLTAVPVAGSYDYSFELGGDVLDKTEFDGNQGWRQRTYGVHEVSISVSRYDDLARKFIEHKMDRDRVYIEVSPGNDPVHHLKGWFCLETTAQNGDIGSLEGQDLQFVLASFPQGVMFTYGGIVVSS